MSGWNYFATRMNGDGTETLLADELPLSSPEITNTLSGPDSISASITPELSRLKGEDGLPLFRSWSTAIYAENEGRIRCGAIVSGIYENGPELSLECVGFTGYLSEMAHTGADEYFDADPLAIAKDIWTKVQAHRGGNLGLQVEDVKSGLKIGRKENPKLTAAKVAEKAAEALENELKNQHEDALKLVREYYIKLCKAAGVTADEERGKYMYQDTAPSGDNRKPYNIWLDKDGEKKNYKVSGDEWVETNGISASLRDAAIKAFNDENRIQDDLALARKKENEAEDARQEFEPEDEADPYTLLYWEDHDLGQRFDDLATETPFDYYVDHEWDGDEIRHTLRLGYPGLGRRRHDLRFVVGENVFEPPELDHSGDDYASHVMVLGAGEGRKMPMAVASREDNRLRRIAVVQDKFAKTEKRVRSIAEKELKLRSGETDVTDIVVLDHPHAPIGSYSLGDEILLQTSDGWSEDMALWCKIVSMTFRPDTNDVSLTVIRVDKV